MIRERGKSCENKQESMALHFLSGGCDPDPGRSTQFIQRKGNKGRDHGCRGKVCSVMVGVRGHSIHRGCCFLHETRKVSVEMRQKRSANETEEKIWNNYLSQQETKWMWEI